MAIDGFASIDFQAFHEETLPERLRGPSGQEARKALAGLTGLAFRKRDGDAVSYLPGAAGIDVEAGDARAATVIEIDHADWEGLVHDYESVAGLLYGGRVGCARGDAMDFVAWEPALRALYAGRPVYDPEDALATPSGAIIDPLRAPGGKP